MIKSFFCKILLLFFVLHFCIPAYSEGLDMIKKEEFYLKAIGMGERELLDELAFDFVTITPFFSISSDDHYIVASGPNNFIYSLVYSIFSRIHPT